MGSGGGIIKLLPGLPVNTVHAATHKLAYGERFTPVCHQSAQESPPPTLNKIYDNHLARGTAGGSQRSDNSWPQFPNFQKVTNCARCIWNDNSQNACRYVKSKFIMTCHKVVELGGAPALPHCPPQPLLCD